MTELEFRRATVDDLDALVALVEEQQSAAACDLSTQESLELQQKLSHEAKLDQTTFF